MLLLLWVPVTLEKFWDIPGFLRALQQQPFPDGWAGILVWLVPAAEGLCIFLLVGGGIDSPTTKKITAGLNKWGFALSTLLMLAFTLFILFGVLDLYEKRPCGCGSVISGLTWNQHLWFNGVFLLISGWGWWLVSKANDTSDHIFIPQSKRKRTDGLFLDRIIHRKEIFAAIDQDNRRRFPRRFAPFPGRPVCTCSSARVF